MNPECSGNLKEVTSNIKGSSSSLPGHFFKKQEGSGFKWGCPWMNKEGCWKNKQGACKREEDSWKRKESSEMISGRSGILK